MKKLFSLNQSPRYSAFCTLWFLLAYVLFPLSSTALTPVAYHAADFTGASNNLPVTLTSLLKVQVNNQTLLVGQPIKFTPANGSYATNVYPGIYNLTIQGIPSGVTCLVPDVTNSVSLANCVISNLGLFSATNLNALITNQQFVVAGGNVSVLTNGSSYIIDIGSTFTNLTASGSFSGSFSGNGGNLTNVSAFRIHRTATDTYPLVYTNIGGIDYLFHDVPASQQTNNADFLFGIGSPTPASSSCGGIFLIMFGTNAIYNGKAGTPFSVLPSGATNYYYDVKVGALNAVGPQTLDINGGTWGLFSNPDWPFYMGGFSTTGETDWLFQDPTNWTVHFPTQPPSGNNVDPRTTGLGAWDTMTIDQRGGQARVTISNLVTTTFTAKGTNLHVASGSVGIKTQLSVGTTNVEGTLVTLLVAASGADLNANYPHLYIKQTTSGWGPNITLDATASSNGRKFGLNSTGASDPAGAGLMTVYDFSLNDYILKLGGTSHNLTIPNGAVVGNNLAAISGTITNSTVIWRVGSGSPEGLVTANIGSIYSRTNGGAGTSHYVKESGTGNTGWAAK